MRPVPQLALDLIKGAEGCKLTVYRDQTGLPTVGYGHADAAMTVGATISQAQADSFLFADATKAAMRIATCVSASRIDALTEHQYAALISFSFNLGFGPRVCPTLIQALNAGQLDAVPADLMLYDRAHVNGQSVEIPGLHNRRAAEATLWKTADVGAAITVAQAAPVAPPPSSYTRAADTPPAPVFTKALVTSKRFVTGCAAAAAVACQQALGDPQSVQDAVKNVADNLSASPLVAHSVALQHINGLLSGAVVALGVAVPALMLLKRFKVIT